MGHEGHTGLSESDWLTVKCISQISDCSFHVREGEKHARTPDPEGWWRQVAEK